MKKILFALLFLLIVPSVFALNFDVEKETTDAVMVRGLEEPVIFNLSVTNNGNPVNVEFYNLLGFDMNPKGEISFGRDETKNVSLTIFPREDLDTDGYYTFKFFIQAEDGSKIEERIIFEVIGLGDAFDIYAEEITPQSEYVTISIENRVNLNFEDIEAVISSPFFEEERDFSLGPYETKNLSVEIDKENSQGLLAGFYTLSAYVNVNGEDAEVGGNIKFSEEDLLNQTERNYGFLIRTNIIEKENDGNVVVATSTGMKKNIISRLFTSFSPSPDVVERDGFSVYYTWENNLSPGEKLTISAKTNWLFPLLIVLFLVAVIFVIKKYSVRDLALRKRVSFVKVRGGEFALKVSVNLEAKEDVERVTIIDKLPHLVKLFEKFGQEKPTKVDEKNRRIEWSFDRLEKGEKRILSYLIYSKVGVLGKFALPTARAFYERDGNIKEAESNRAFFVAEQKENGKNSK